MANIVLPLEEMTVQEKLNAIELIWESLINKPDQIPIPNSHIELLEHRHSRYLQGKEVPEALDDAIEWIRNEIDPRKIK